MRWELRDHKQLLKEQQIIFIWRTKEYCAELHAEFCICRRHSGLARGIKRFRECRVKSGEGSGDQRTVDKLKYMMCLRKDAAVIRRIKVEEQIYKKVKIFKYLRNDSKWGN